MKATSGFIYKIINIVNGKLYIGQTINAVEYRWAEHIKDSKRNGSNRILCKAIRKYGPDSFKIEIIEKIKEVNLNNREIFWIKEFNTTSFGEGFGYNMTLGGNGMRGNILSKESKEKIGAAHKGKKESDETKQRKSFSKMGNKNSFFGKNHTEETKTLLSLKRSRPIFCKELQETFPSIKAAADKLSTWPSAISNVLKGKKDNYKNLTFEYVANLGLGE